MKKIDKLVNKVEEMIKEANKNADVCSMVDYDCGFYAGRGDALEDVLKLLKENK